MRYSEHAAKAVFFYLCVQLGLGWSAEDLASDTGITWIFAVAITAFGFGVSSLLTWHAQRSGGKSAEQEVRSAPRPEPRAAPFRLAS